MSDFFINPYFFSLPPLAGGLNDTTYNTYDNKPLFNSSVRHILVQSDGKIIMVGGFSTYNAVSANGIVRLNTDGTLDTAFMANVGTGSGAGLQSAVLQSDGKILIVGGALNWNGSTNAGIVRLNSDGTRDTAFSTSVGTGGSTVQKIALQSDGKIILTGSFTAWSGVTVNRIVRLNSNGTRDTAFTTNTGTAANSTTNIAAIQSDGKIIITGQFATWQGVTVNRIVRLNSDGTRDTAFNTNTGTGASSTTSCVAIQSDGKILIGGSFTTWNGAAVTSLVRLNSDGTRDTSFSVGTQSGGVTNLSILADGKILAAGAFFNWNGSIRRGLVCLNSNGTENTAFSANIGVGGNSGVNALLVQSDGKILIGGLATTLWNNVYVKYIVQLNSNGTHNTSIFAPSVSADSNISTSAVGSDGKIVFGGTFTFWNGVTVGRVVKLDSDGTRDTTFTTNSGTGADSTVNVVAIDSNNKIIVGGGFTFWDGVAVNRIVRLNSDGTRDTLFTTNAGTATNGTVTSIAIQSDGKILLGGLFTTWNSVTVNYIVRLNSDGTRDTAFTTNTGTAANSGAINSIAIQSDGKIIVGGGFTTWNGVTVNYIVRLNTDGTRDTAFTTNTGTGANSTVWSMAIQSDGKIIVGGSFFTWNGVTVRFIVRLNSDGTRDTAFTTNNGTGPNDLISTMAIQSDGKIVIGGGFASWNGTIVRSYNARIGGG